MAPAPSGRARAAPHRAGVDRTSNSPCSGGGSASVAARKETALPFPSHPAPAPSSCYAPSAAPGQPAAPLMSPEKGAAAAGEGEVRGQCNIYSDVTFHFYETGKRCRSRKRAVRDIPAWEAAVTPSTTHSRLQRDSGEPGPGRQESSIRPSEPHQNHTQPGMGSGLSPPLLPSAPPCTEGQREWPRWSGALESRDPL